MGNFLSCVESFVRLPKEKIDWYFFEKKVCAKFAITFKKFCLLLGKTTDFCKVNLKKNQKKTSMLQSWCSAFKICITTCILLNFVKSACNIRNLLKPACFFDLSCRVCLCKKNRFPYMFSLYSVHPRGELFVLVNLAMTWFFLYFSEWKRFLFAGLKS